jgi:hypothetical protein
MLPRAVQALAPRIRYPQTWGLAYRDIMSSMGHYTMEEWANVVHLGSLIAACGPPAFQRLWRLLRPALLHYLYGFNSAVEEMRTASNLLYEYAEELEKLVIACLVRCWPQQGASCRLAAV